MDDTGDRADLGAHPVEDVFDSVEITDVDREVVGVAADALDRRDRTANLSGGQDSVGDLVELRRGHRPAGRRRSVEHDLLERRVVDRRAIPLGLVVEVRAPEQHERRR